MHILFEKTEAYFNEFHKSRKQSYLGWTNDFNPKNETRYSRDISDWHRSIVHEMMHEFAGQLGQNYNLLDLSIPSKFATPEKVVKEIMAYMDVLHNDKLILEELIIEYSKGEEIVVESEFEVPFPLAKTLEIVNELIDVLNYSLSFDEMAPYLEEELFNIYVGIPFNHECYFGLNKQDLKKLFDAIRETKDFVRIDGRKILLKGFDNLLIYNNLFARPGSDKASLKDVIPKTQIIHKFKTKTELLSYYGQDVSSDFDIPEPPQELYAEEKLNQQPNLNTNSRKRIFVSHSSKDENLVNAFVDKVLILGMGVDRDDIFYTSGAGTGIKSSEDFKQRITKEMIQAKAVIQILTPNYKASEVCLYEMGAAWAISDIIIPFLGPPFKYDKGFLHATTQQIKLNDKTGLMSVYDDHKVELFKVGQKSAVLNKQIEEFVELINKS